VRTTEDAQEEVAEEKIDPTHDQPQSQKNGSNDSLGEALFQKTKPKQKEEKKGKKEKKTKVNKGGKEKKSKKVSSKTIGTGLERDRLSREDVELSDDTFKPVLCQVRYATHYIPPPPVT
jgi:hypothetical protein